jgi:hypothetical protein
MVLDHMSINSLIVEEVLRHATTSLITDVTLLVGISAMNKQLIITVKPRPTKRTQRMSFEAALIDRSWIVVTVLHVLR